MSIRFAKYVSITSGVGGNNVVAERALIARLFTDNPLIPPATVLEFDTASDVGLYFGTSSEEYLRALFYFSFISKSISQPQKISYSRWVDTAAAPRIYGNTTAKLLATLAAVTAGGFTLTLGGVANVMTGINLSGAADLAAVAALIQTKVRLGTGTIFTAATVVYNNTRGSFDLLAGATGAATISVTDGAQTPAELLGWLDGNVIVSPGAALETISGTLDTSNNLSDNFGSFYFMPALTLSQVTEAATWNAGQNVLYQYHVPVSPGNASAWSAALLGIEGVGLTLDTLTTEYPEMAPGMLLAATDYDRRNSVQNYMYQQFALTPNVTDNTSSDTYDAERVNYYGQTQTAGQKIAFYQRGKLMGGVTAPVDMNVYGNEQWLKDAAGVAFMNLLLALPQVPANSQGRAAALNQLLGVINRAIFNGTISVGKPLNTTQIAAIGVATGDDTAWRQVQNSGWWDDVVIESYVASDATTEWKIVYTLVYSKDDTIRKVEGEHVLI